MSKRIQTGFLSVVVMAAAMVRSTVVAVADTGDSTGLPEVVPLLIEDDFRISGLCATHWNGEPAVAYNSTDNQYLVVWTDERKYDSRRYDIYGQRIAANGAPLGNDFRISGRGATDDDWDPAVAYNSTDNQYLVVWTDERNYLTRELDIYGRKVAADGTHVGNDFRIGGRKAIYDSDVSAVAYNSTWNQHMVVWSDARDALERSDDIYGRRVSG